MSTSTRPEPVLDAARIASAVSGLVVAVGAVLVILGITTQDEVDNWASISGAVVTALGVLVATLLPYYQALRARAQVTPGESPMEEDEDGNLVPLVRAQVGDDGAHLSPHAG